MKEWFNTKSFKLIAFVWNLIVIAFDLFLIIWSVYNKYIAYLGIEIVLFSNGVFNFCSHFKKKKSSVRRSQPPQS